MNNSITISIPFSFKGKDLNPTCRVDLDRLMQTGSLPCLYTHLANECGISPYSYEHDVMMMGDMEFDSAEGLAADFLRDGAFDSEGFEKAWLERKKRSDLEAIARRCMEVERLGDVPGLEQALLEAWELGWSEKKIDSTPMPGF